MNTLTGSFPGPVDSMSDSYLLPALEEEEEAMGAAVPLPSSLLKMKQIHLDIRNSQINSNASQTIARLKKRSQTPNSGFSLFDFNSIAEHKATSHKWSKLTTLPHIQVGADQEQPEDGHLMELDFHGNLFDPASKENETRNAEDRIDKESLTKMEGKEQGISSRHKPMNVGNVTIEFNPLSEQKTPRSDFASKPVSNSGEGRFPVNSTSIGNAGMMYTSPITSNASVMGHKIPPRNRGHVEQFSTINIGDSLLGKHGGDSRTLRGLEKRMSDLQNAVLVNNWIKILESTKDKNSSISVDGGPSGASHRHAVGISAANMPAANNNVYPRYVPTMPLGHKQRTMANIDLAKYFNVPRSVLKDVDRLKQQNNSDFRKQPPSHVQPSSHVHAADEDLAYTGGTYPRPEKKPAMTNANVSAVEGPPVSIGQHHKSISYRRWLPRLKVDPGLTDLLAIQRLETGVQMEDGHDTGFTSHDSKSHDSRSGEVAQERHVMLHLHNHQPDLQSKNQDYHSKRQLQIKVNIPREMRDSVAVKPLLKLSPRVDNTGSKRGYSETGNAMFGSNANQHIDNLLFHLPFPEHKRKGNQRSVMQDKVHKTRQNPFLTYTDRKDVSVNAYPGLSIVGSSMLDTSELAWKEEAKALIIQMLESKGR